MKYLLTNSVTNQLLLKRFNKAGFVQWPVHKGQFYVNESKSLNPVDCAFMGGIIGIGYHFQEKGQDYVAKYCDGCFHPFVFHATAI